MIGQKMNFGGRVYPEKMFMMHFFPVKYENLENPNLIFF